MKEGVVRLQGHDETLQRRVLNSHLTEPWIRFALDPLLGFGNSLIRVDQTSPDGSLSLSTLPADRASLGHIREQSLERITIHNRQPYGGSRRV